MITKFITDVRTSFNPFSANAKTARLFLAFLPSNAHSTMKIDRKMLPRSSTEKSLLEIKFKDGKQMNLDTEVLGIKGIIDEIDRHSRILARKDELTGN